MKEVTGDTYQSSQTAKALIVSDAKVGKTSAIVASLLGVAPWQKAGGVVDSPENLHVVTFDANAAGGLKKFLTQTCNAPTSALAFRIYNMQDDFRAASASQSEYDRTLYNTFMTVINTVKQRAAKGGVHAVLVSSITGLAAGLQRAIQGPVTDKKGGGMDMSKWADFGSQIAEVRNFAQSEMWHTVWEGHLAKKMKVDKATQQAVEKTGIQINGASGDNFAFNVEQVFQLRRMFNQVHAGSKCDQFYLDTKPTGDFVANGRGFNESLEAKEPDMTLAFEKLGLKVGKWKPNK